MSKRMNAKIVYSIGASLRQPNSAAKIEKAIVYGAVNKIEIMSYLQKYQDIAMSLRELANS
jgi:hypothetical protein